MTRGQLPLPFAHREAFGRDDFLVADENRAALGWLDRWPDWPGPAVVVHGPEACGKSHLGAVYRAKTGAVSVDAEALADPAGFFEAGLDGLLDDLSDVLASQGENSVLHLYNAARDAGRHLLILSRRAPAALDLRLADLASRLKAAPSAEILSPGDDLLAAVLVKQFADRQLTPEANLIPFLLKRMDRSFEAAKRTVDRLDRASLQRRRALTIRLASEVLQDDDA
ncbi:MAG: HdaA/DnaA family protein [Magnetovibrionaceae bacterium]